ncbi:MAG: bifunctional hydroxymethylpyrimidine kinase/phosphomethylpyrimidine kinase [Tissierellia bacterium]|nr:bifunctional hydroxymethylpyrimidine kinase/phosphomethylpyrimidine kinase [Tissierellia bacterium]
MKKKTTLTIAGSDSSGGAGIQADLKTMSFNGTFSMSAITAITAQNTKGVTDISILDKKLVENQIRAVFDDIFPDAIKIAMVYNKDIMLTIKQLLLEYDAKNIVLDPVMVATSGARLIGEEDTEVLIDELIPIADLITPNIPEAKIIANMDIKTKEDMEVAAKKIYQKTNTAVLLKGGHNLNDANDYLYDKEGMWFLGDRIDNENTHGTGCTLSSAIASNLAKGYSMKDSIKRAKDYLSNCLLANLNLGEKSGPMDHSFKAKSKFLES